MPEFDSATLTRQMMFGLSPDLNSWIYNGLDCCVTAEIYESLMSDLAHEPENVRSIYQFTLDKSAAFFEMSLRGIRVDPEAKASTIAMLESQIAALQSRFRLLTTELFGYPISPTSPPQVKSLFYEILSINPIKKRNSKGIYAPTVDESALEKLRFNFWAEPFINYILAIRTLSKKLSFLRTGIDADGRIRTSLNIAGTNTGRLASSASDFGTGTNLQNVDTALRYPFVSDPGMLFVNVDLEQADARNVAAIIHNMFYGEPGYDTYLNACESGDTHTTVCKLSFPELDWPEDPKNWKSFCDSIIFHGQDSYRQAAKKLGHGTNYYGQPRQMAVQTHVPEKVVAAFQKKYFGAFPLIKRWQDETIRLIRTTGELTTIYGRRRHFFGRGDAAETWRQAIAYAPQSMTGHQIDSGILNLWRNLPQAELLIQVHDSILFQVPFAEHETLVPEALRLLHFPFELKGGRVFSVPLEAKTGWNWGNRNEDKKTKEVTNPWGLAKWTGKDSRQPPKQPPRSIKRLIG